MLPVISNPENIFTYIILGANKEGVYHRVNTLVNISILMNTVFKAFASVVYNKINKIVETLWYPVSIVINKAFLV